MLNLKTNKITVDW